MYTTAISILLASLLVSIILGWIAGNKASAIVYSKTEESLNRKARQLLRWTVILSVPAAAVIGSVLLLTASGTAALWADRLTILLIAAIQLLLLWMAAHPRLRRIRIATNRKLQKPLDVRLRSRAAQPALIVPFQFSALGPLTGFYLFWTSRHPFSMLDTAIPLIVLAIAVLALWTVHLNRSSRVSLTGEELPNRPWRRLFNRLGILVAAIAIAFLPFNMAMKNSLLADKISMAEGTMDYGKGSSMVSHSHPHGETAVQTASSGAAAAPVSVDQLSGPREGKADVTYTLTAEKKTIQLSSGKTVEAWTYNGQSPGPELRMRQGQLVEVTLINKNIDSGVTIHWHGLDVPNAEDGVAGATQNAVMPGESHTYRFIAEQTGSFWYHSHQESKEAVQKGLFGPLVVEPAEGLPEGTKDVAVMTHIWDNAGMAIGRNDGIERMTIAPGTPVRLRLINTDDWVRQTYRLIGADFQVSAIDGTALNEPGDLRDVSLTITTGGRFDVTFVMPETPVYLAVGPGAAGGKLGILMSSDGNGELPIVKGEGASFDPLHYGKPAETAFNANSAFDREFKLILDNSLGFYNGQFGLRYTLNGELFPNTPMFMVREGELVKTTIINRGMVEHPMHLHGHHALVLSRNGEPSTGSPWWSDTLDVLPGDVYEIAFVADNPGLWMDHCHNLTHAATGMSMHLMYEGVTSPYEVGADTVNHPE
ncbi:multicopper oxidase family protein [Paenibacillus sp. NEAU-GSW1]|uniref:multicopper oxidase family protein n=1 Tax=Paenibacillus sp. NEAU-GSW1 TaxID=2682486 RepID=UPI0012E26C2A|nr:multicopper oxidase family protein [Paenibacillus sp. NEAU-GSW1]MUT66564.1 multicopper oxidase domain-containing protein [Paenibacillus sp. NEAU-GSW1]